MKKFFFVLSLTLSVGFVSCNKQDSNPVIAPVISDNFSVQKNSSYGDAIFAPNTLSAKIASFVLINNTKEPLKVNNITIVSSLEGVYYSNFQNIKLFMDGIQTGSTIGSFSPTSSFTTSFMIEAGTKKVIDFYVDILNFPSGSLVTSLNVAGTKIISASSIKSDTITGQKVSIIYPSISSILSPKEGASYKTGDTVRIKWSSQNVSKISILLNKLGYEYPIALYIRNSGEYYWIIPDSLPISNESGNPSTITFGDNFKIMILVENDYNPKIFCNSGIFSINH